MIFGSIQISLFLRTDVACSEVSDLDQMDVALLGFSFGWASASDWLGFGFGGSGDTW
jgi:hypothetical protein